MFGRPHNPEYARERLPLEGPRAGNPQGLRDAHWVVFSAARSQRPGAFRNPKDATAKESCPFCEGHETITPPGRWERSEEHTSELQSLTNLVCRLLLEKKKYISLNYTHNQI